MPLTTKDGHPGLLAKGLFGETLLRELSDMTKEIEPITDARLLSGKNERVSVAMSIVVRK